LLFELDKYDQTLQQGEPAAPELPYAPVANIQKMSLLYWAEHCVECAAPVCYLTCDLYQPRVDLRCRRFTFGALKNSNFPSSRGYGVEISFKKWAKMEAYGNLRLLPAPYVLLTEKLVEWTAPAANFFGKFMTRLTKRVYWKALTHMALEALVRRLDRKRGREASPDAFLLEVYNPTDQVIRMQLSFSALPAEAQPKNGLSRISDGFTATIACPIGYSRHEIEVALLRRLIDSSPQFLISMTPEADNNNARLVFLSSEFVKFDARPENSETKKVKCVVFDLDNTLWTGVLIEGDDVVVQSETLELLKLLDDRGILLSIASKNHPELTWNKLRELGLSEYFLYPQIGWNPKSQSIKLIADQLNISVDSLAFIDDNPFELDEVARAFPQVLCVDAKKMPSLSSDPRFRGSATEDARKRRQFYRYAAAREAAAQSHGSDYLGFLASCEISLEISFYSSEDSERVAELVQRTNQLNFSGRKHTRQELEQILSDPVLDKYVLRCSDRYGSYGTIGFCIVERVPNTLCIQDFMLSCRVQGKLLEKAFFYHLFEHHNPEPARTLWINFQQTARNKPAQQVLESLGCRPCEPGAHDFSHGMVLTARESLRCDVIQVLCCSHS
jgi:FkbH-like protein